MNEDTLIHVARLPGTAAHEAVPDALWLDTQSLRFLVVPVANGDDHEAPATPVEDYLAAHPDRAEAVRTALTERFREASCPTRVDHTDLHLAACLQRQRQIQTVIPTGF